ncbi:MarR family winged helix-turn-helix transcriptional regulator [Streptomyces yaanensis]|uniref:MarR family winged helix-turn-helix transcriptional regulator n=1 Tax=Streptomyces yaanensis TaxID=1142239 RepID=A0ABV7SCV3_9ACTN|nr:MarR family winged helix-turn-helix transcriptional regulator [Streptomyces sp. CGMCC 4.7035]WNB99000.1 MarR family winged helix-turn-helix transcriptional regulator [Streptomyces sp. CGMCC 4.7035]
MARQHAPTPLESRLGYLLKHAQLRLARASAETLAPFGVDGHELAVLVVIAGDEPLSQIEVGARLGVDRTTMVALIDGLEDRGLVERRRSPRDRRKNIVGLTAAGEDCLRRGEEARREAERRFLAPLDEEEAASLVRALQVLVATERSAE